MGLPFIIARDGFPLWLVGVEDSYLHVVNTGDFATVDVMVPSDVIGVVSVDPAAVLFGGRLLEETAMRKAAESPRQPRLAPRGPRFAPLASPWGHFTGFSAVRGIIEKHRHEVPSEEAIRLSAIFAVSTVRTSIEQAEKSFNCFVDLYRKAGEMPPVEEVKRCFRGLQNSKSRMFSEVAAYAPIIREAIASGVRDRALRKHLATMTDLPVGLGLSKLSFTLALLGHDVVCLDARLLTRMFDTREKATRVEDGWGKTGRRVSELGVARYHRVEDAFLKGNPLWDPSDPIGRAKAQWQSWEHVGGEPATHSVWLSAVSGDTSRGASDATLSPMAHVPVIYEAGVVARECPAGGSCPHSHPPEVPSLPCPPEASEDYIPKGPDGRPVGDKTPSYFDAKREAEKHNGYVEWADEAKRGAKPKRLKWHRGTAEGVTFLYAEGAMGTYQVARQRVNRRQGILRWGVSVDGRPLKSFDDVAKAKQFAANYDEITAIGGYHVAPPRSPAPSPQRWNLDKKLPAGLPQCAPFISSTRDEEKFAACMKLADRIGPLRKPADFYALLRDYCERQTQEVFLVVSLDLHGKLLGIEEVAKGQIDRVNVGIDDVLTAALSRKAKGFVVAHCHPTGKARPSKADRDLTKTIEAAREPFGNNLKLVDHIVIGVGEFSSIRMRKLFRAKK